MSAPSHAKTTYFVDIGGPMDELFIQSGFSAVEGPYPQYGSVWDSQCRWAFQGATVRLPVFPGVENTIEIRCNIGAGEGNHLHCFVNGQEIAKFARREDCHYEFEVKPDLLQGKGWADLKLETDLEAPKSAGDGRDLRIAMDWIKVSADAPARDFFNEALKAKGIKLSNIVSGGAPTHWKMRRDPDNVGDSYAPRSFRDITYDDSAFETVPTAYIPQMRRGDACWYRAWVSIGEGIDEIRKNLRLPGDGFEKDGQRQVWVNGMELTGEGDPTRRTADALTYGMNLIVVKIMKGPLPGPSGDALVEQPKYSGEWSPAKVLLKLGPLVLNPGFASAKTLSVHLISPSGKTVGSANGQVVVLPDGKRGFDPKTAWALSEYGEHKLVVEDDQGHRQQFPVHFLGVHMYHWGWYTALGGTTWNGFTACSNDYLDQLLDHLGDWGRPHHSLCWIGAIFEPGTGFHLTKGVDYIKKFRDAIAAKQLDFIGMTFPPRNICTDFGESLVRSMRRSQVLYKSQLNYTPRRFFSHDADLTPMLPQIMQMCGYDTYCIAENWWGQGQSVPNSRDCYWANADGSKVRVLDSWYHGISPVIAAHRAVEQGKPAVMCCEEFACLDRTVFLIQEDLDTLASEGIILRPVSLDEYQKITDKFARELVYQGDDALCYKGWTGGGEGEVEYEKANRLLETRLVALENLVAFARWLGIQVDQKPIDEWWGISLRYHECHNHWGNGNPDLTAKLRQGVDWTDSEMRQVAGLIAQKTKGPSGVAVFNPIGFERRGLVHLDVPEGTKALLSGGTAFPVQPDPEKPGSYLASLPDLPSIGYRTYQPVPKSASAGLVSATAQMDRVVLSNGLIKLMVNADGIISVEDSTGKNLVSAANAVYFAKPQGQAPDEPISAVGNPLNLDHYCRPIASGGPKVICQGPVLAAVECNLSLAEYPGVSVILCVSLASGERQARIRLTMDFNDKTIVWPKGGPQPHEGTYLPGIFIAFPMLKTAKPMADMAYCVTDDVLASTNHETFMNIPFRSGTFNTLSLAGPDTGEYAVLTRGLPDFFVIREPSAYLGMSLGIGTDNCPYHGRYIHEYALYVPEAAQRKQMGHLAYKAAQSFLIDPVAVRHQASAGKLSAEGSFASASGESVMITGAQAVDNELLLRVLQLDAKSAKTSVTGLPSLAGAHVLPGGKISAGALDLGPRAVREIRIPLRRK